VYGKENNEEKYINVVTDIDCPYCRKFHDDINTYIENGIKVRYLVFAIKTSSKKRVISAWCADDKNDAFTLLKKEQKIGINNCANPIEEHQNIISSIGVSSTPSIFLPNGKLIQGYMSPRRGYQEDRKLENQLPLHFALQNPFAIRTLFALVHATYKRFCSSEISFSLKGINNFSIFLLFLKIPGIFKI
jgi:hypothetical protein